jgi:hypothetical protein
MIRVKLFTADGGFVVEGEIPPFQTEPDVLIWGERVFKFGGMVQDGARLLHLNYIECFSVALVRTV